MLCTDTANKRIAISIRPKPVPRFVLADTVGCVPLTVTLMDSSLNADSILINWGFGSSQFASPNTTLAKTYFNAGTFVPQLTASSVEGCRVTLTSTQSIHALTPATANSQAKDTIGCGPKVVTLRDQSIGDSIRVWWGDASQSVALATGGTHVHTYLNRGRYTLVQVAFRYFNGILFCTDTIKHTVTVTGFDSTEVVQLQIKTITVDSSLHPEKINVGWSHHPEAVRYELYRADIDRAARYQKVYTTTDTSVKSWTDTSSRPWEDVRYYRLLAFDSCGNAGLGSNYGRNMVLNLRDENTSQLATWDEYQQWTSGVSQYELYRRRTPDSTWELISSQSSLNYRDVDFFKEATSSAQYRVKAVSNQAESAWSNTVKIDFPTLLQWTNAFTPNGDGLNDKLYYKGSNLKSINLTVLSRWGDVIYQGDGSVNGGWDGLYQGKPVPIGAYAVIVLATDLEGKQIRKTGTVMVVE